MSEAWVRLRDPAEEHGTWWGTCGAIRRMRAVLAAADDDGYRQAVARLAGFRGNPLLRLVTAYLVLAWFARHPAAAALPLIPAALGPPVARRRAAGTALVRVAERQGTAPVVEAARAQGHCNRRSDRT
ncbi:hypothetical protein [Actinomadura rubrisoli]|uniref:Uncharacterized protein n=1 Tax=Actinomadura rubrisoli TaxID=2530368 RepID=A0A4R5AFJ2_9ACTN|nr:hypothetical protein [Actinomadura rubrisoli]TDD70116.1 hypothetical protein E1298_36920 [Actinomadura rubrisoli]